MSYRRYMIDLAIPEPLPSTLRGQLTAIEEHIRVLKSFAVKINEGKDNEEMTTRAVWHICHHDSGGNCEPESEI